MAKKRALLFSNWFSPGYKGGGSQAAAANLVHALGDEFEFSVVTRDRDSGENEAFSSIATGSWNRWTNAQVRYLAPAELSFSTIKSIIRQTPHDLIHLNSVVSLPFAAYPLLAHHFKTASASPILISPHGEMALQALTQKYFRKATYIWGSKVLRIFQRVLWLASTPQEEEDIRRVWGKDAKISIAPVLPPRQLLAEKDAAKPAKKSGALNAVFLARIDRMKNLDFAIDAAAAVSNATLDIYGPIGQPDYWVECQKRIEASGRPKDFRYRGSIPPKDVVSTLAQYDVLFLPSQNESFGYAILEALSAGCPVLISDRTPWRELEHCGIGYDLSLDEPVLFRDALLRLRDMDEVAHHVLRRRAREYARSYLENSPAKAATRAIYMTALSRR